MESNEQSSADTDTLVSSLVDHLRALLNVGSKTATLALAEVKLAVNSIVLSLVTLVIFIFMLFVTWLTGLLTVFLYLQKIGFSPLSTVGILLLIQITVCIALALTQLHLLKLVKFSKTRKALSQTALGFHNPSTSTH